MPKPALSVTAMTHNNESDSSSDDNPPPVSTGDDDEDSDLVSFARMSIQIPELFGQASANET